MKALPKLSKLTSLDLHGDTWEKTLLTLSDIAFLQHLVQLKHLGLHHYELECNIQDLTGGDVDCQTLRGNPDTLQTLARPYKP